jgi:hypothetical protein
MRMVQQNGVQQNGVQHGVQHSELAAPSDWLKSGRNLDFCLLAFCSCVLTLLCHQTSVHNSSSSSVRTPNPTNISIDFTIKAGLFTSSQSEDPEQAPEL